MLTSTNFLFGGHNTSGVAELPLITGAEQLLPTVTEIGPRPAAKGDPVMAVSAPVVALIVYPEMLLERLFAT